MTDIHKRPFEEPLTAVTTPSEREVVVTRVLDAPRALVWKAWTEPEHVARWWRPAGFENVDCKIDLRVGGTFRVIVRAPDGTDYPCTGVFREIVRPERIVYDGTPDDRNAGGAGMPPGARVTVTFEEDGGKTRLTVHTFFETATAREAAEETGFTRGWPEGLDHLAALLRSMDSG